MLAKLRRTQREIKKELLSPHTTAKTRKLLKTLRSVVRTVIDNEQRSMSLRATGARG